MSRGTKNFIETEKHGDEDIVITVKFDPYSLHEVYDVKNAIKEIELNDCNVILNLEHISLITSPICGIFLVIKKRLKEGKKLFLKGVRSELKSIVDSMRRLKLFEISDNTNSQK